MSEPTPPIELEYRHSVPRTPISGHALAGLLIGVLTWMPLISAAVAYLLAKKGERLVADGSRRSRRLVVVALVVSMVNLVLAPLVTYAAIRMVMEARENALRVRSAANVRAILQCVMLYSAENKGFLPADLTLLTKYAPASVMISPKGDPKNPAMILSTGPCDYIFGVSVAKINQIRGAASTPILYEPPSHYQNKMTIVGFADGHVEMVTPPRMQTLIGQVDYARAPSTQPAAGAPK